MLRIRLSRTGRKGQPSYRVVVADHARPIQGRYVEVVGNYNPQNKIVTVEKEKIEGWIKQGAQPSQTVARLLKKEGFQNMDKYIEHVHFVKKPGAEAEAAPAPIAPTPAPAPKVEAPKVEAAPVVAEVEAAPAEEVTTEVENTEETPAETAEENVETTDVAETAEATEKSE